MQFSQIAMIRDSKRPGSFDGEVRPGESILKQFTIESPSRRFYMSHGRRSSPTALPSEAEIDEHDSGNKDLELLISFEQDINRETLIKLRSWPPSRRYHYDIFKSVCEELSGFFPLSRSVRLRAAALMMPLR